MVFKKGDSTNLRNYRPISLLNSINQIYAAILERRIMQQLDKYLNKTQYGFRKKNTSAAISIVRRIISMSEKTNNTTLMLLIDWEKAVDAIDHAALWEALQIMGFNNKCLNIMKPLYKNQTFFTEIDGEPSFWGTQKPGMRQGCPTVTVHISNGDDSSFPRCKQQTRNDSPKTRQPSAWHKL